ncbi:MAG: tyrosine-type recombinase/integrase [Prevotellaceae bacterium]|nr:tyrosine-type recombinase/integrase [Candidatus Faecinaster equi]
MKQANGNGSITKLKGKRRNPFWVRSPEVKYVENGKVKRKRTTIGYYKTQKDALAALSEYQQTPYDLEKYTVKDVWDAAKKNNIKWDEERIAALDGTFRIYLSPIQDMLLRNVRTEHLQKIIDDCTKRSGTKNSIKLIMRSIYKYALSKDIVLKDYSQFIQYTQDDVQKERIIFPASEIKLLWDRVNEWPYAFMLILLYTGCRFEEIADNKIDGLNLENNSIYVAEYCAKTPSSIRTVPIHDDILPVIKQYMGKKYLFEKPSGAKVSYQNMYYRDLPKINAYLNNDHTFHDTRHTYITRMKELKVDRFYVDELTGHVHKNISDDVYTHVGLEYLRVEMNKLDYFADVTDV